MLQKLKKIKFPLTLLISLGLLVWYLYRLRVFPIFADEAIYLYWAQGVTSGNLNPFISVFDGKPPLFIWGAGLSHYFIKDLLLAGRLASVLGLFIGMIFIERLLSFKSKDWSKLAPILVLITPFIFFHTRLSLLDTWLSVFLTLFILSLTPKSKSSWGWLSGLLLGLSFWVKTSALLFFPLPYLGVIFSKNKKNHFIQAIISSFIFGLTLIPLKLTPWFSSLFNRSQDFTYSIDHLLRGNLNHILPNFINLLSWLNFYLTWPVLILFLIGLYQGIKKKNKTVINLFLATFLLTGSMITLGKVISPRYYLPLGFFIPLVASYSLSLLKRDISLVILAAIFSITLPINYLFQKNHFISHLPKIDDQQYLQDWSSGIGIEPVSNYINDQAKNTSVKVLTEGYFGTLPDGLFVHQADKDWNGMEIVGVGTPGSEDFYRELEESNAEKIYYVGNADRINPEAQEYLQLIESYQKKPDGAPLQIYLIKPTQ